MAGLEELVHMVVRQATATVASAATAVASTRSSSQGCPSDNDYNGQIGARISAIFVILIGSLFGKQARVISQGTSMLTEPIGAVFPVFAQKNQGLKVPQWAFFIAKYFGSGVIIATAFIHVSPDTTYIAPSYELGMQQTDLCSCSHLRVMLLPTHALRDR